MAANAVSSGCVVAYPTEGVWGLGCNPLDRQAVERIYFLKGRPDSKGVILIADSVERLEPFVKDMPALPAQITPTTWLISHGGYTPVWVTGGSDKVAIRITQHPLVAALCAAAETPIVSTSANPAGRRPALSAMQVARYFGGFIDVIVTGPRAHNRGASQIIDWETKEVIRKAAV